MAPDSGKSFVEFALCDCEVAFDFREEVLVSLDLLKLIHENRRAQKSTTWKRFPATNFSQGSEASQPHPSAPCAHA